MLTSVFMGPGLALWAIREWVLTQFRRGGANVAVVFNSERPPTLPSPQGGRSAKNIARIIVRSVFFFCMASVSQKLGRKVNSVWRQMS